MSTFLKYAQICGLALAALFPVDGSLAASPAPNAGSTATIREVSVIPGGASVEIQIAASQPVATQTQLITDPDRLVIDFPNAVPATSLRDFGVNRGDVKGVRVGLFSENPPTTRVVLDLASPQRFQLFPSGSNVIVKMLPTARIVPTSGTTAVRLQPQPAPPIGMSNAPTAAVSGAVAPNAGQRPLVAANMVPPAVAAKPLPKLQVQFRDGKLSIWADKVSLTEVMNEVRRRTGAEVVVPQSGSQEQIVANLGPAPARDVLTALLNGSKFNFVMVGSDNNPSQLRGVYLTAKGGGGGGEIQYPAVQAARRPRPIPRRTRPTMEPRMLTRRGKPRLLPTKLRLKKLAARHHLRPTKPARPTQPSPPSLISDNRSPIPSRKRRLSRDSAAKSVVQSFRATVA